MVDIRNKIQVLDVVSGKGAAGVIPTTINTVKQEPSRFQPYRNTYQKHQQQPVLRDNNKLAYSQSNLNILSFPSQGEVKRPTLESIASHAAAQGREVTTPQQLLDMCCQFPACYDPLYQVAWLCYALLQCSFTFDFFSQFPNLLSRFSSLSLSLHSWWSLSLPPSQLCIDTCRKCEQVFPVTSWLPCPPLLNIPDCTSPNLSWMVGVFSSFCFNEFTLIRNHTLDPTRYLSRAHCLWRATLILGLLETLCPSTVSLPWARFQYYSHQYWYLPI